jgi:hypothetical protein
MFSCFTGHHQVLRMEDVMSSLLADGLPKDVVCFVLRASRDDHDTELAFDDEELEDNDSEDENYEVAGVELHAPRWVRRWVRPHPCNDEDEDNGEDEGEEEEEVDDEDEDEDNEEVDDDEEEDDESDDH